jgi:glycosyltransferase involved in cell wall biosynthesis
LSAPSRQIGIVVPVYRAEQFLRVTLESMLAQTVCYWQCVLVDDGSPDNSYQIACEFAERDPRFRVVQQANQGVSAARNRGFAELSPTCQYVTFMDQDDAWLPDALECLYNEIEKHPEAVGVHGLADMIDAKGEPFLPGNFSSFGRKRIGYDGHAIVDWDPALPTTFETLMHTGRVYPPGLLLVRRSAYEKVGAWDSTLSSVQDWDMCIRLSRLGDLRFLDRVILQYRRHEDNGSNNHERNVREIRFLHHKTFFAPENTETHRAMVRGGWKAWQVYKLREKWLMLCGYLKKGQIVDVGKMTGHLLIHVYRYVRGYPTPTGV